MLSNEPFYFSLTRKYVVLVGSLFNDISIIRTDENGRAKALIKVPITYSPKDKMLARVQQDPELNRAGAMPFPTPCISFELESMEYDSQRKLNPTNKIVIKSDIPTEQDKHRYQYTPVPYNFHFKVNVFAKNIEDGTKIIEQILPYFTPEWTTKVQLVPEMELSIDIPIILNGVSFNDDYAVDLVDRRNILWTLDLTLKGFLYGPVKKSGIIKFIDIKFRIPKVADGDLVSAVGNTDINYEVTIQPGLTANGQPVNWHGKANNSLNTVPYVEIDVNEDYGFITQIYDRDTGE